MSDYQEYIVKVYPNRTEWYNQRNQLHRENGPAIEYTNGDKCWYKNGHRHREDGPAVEYADGKKLWYLEGVEYTEQEFNAKLKPAEVCCVADGEIIMIGDQKYKLQPLK